MLLWQAGQPFFICLFILHGKTFNVGQSAQTLQPNSFIPVMHRGAIDLYYFILLSITFTFARGQEEVKAVVSFSDTLFN